MDGGSWREIELFVLLTRSPYCRFLNYISILSPLAQVKNAWTHTHKRMQYKREPGLQLRLLASTKTDTCSLNPRNNTYNLT